MPENDVAPPSPETRALVDEVVRAVFVVHQDGSDIGVEEFTALGIKLGMNLALYYPDEARLLMADERVRMGPFAPPIGDEEGARSAMERMREAAREIRMQDQAANN